MQMHVAAASRCMGFTARQLGKHSSQPAYTRFMQKFPYAIGTRSFSQNNGRYCVSIWIKSILCMKLCGVSYDIYEICIDL